MSKPWMSREWKEKRKAILQERKVCEICGDGVNEGKVLVLHHPEELEQARLQPRVTPRKLLFQWYKEPANAAVVAEIQSRYPAASVERKVCSRGHVSIRATAEGDQCLTCGRKNAKASLAVGVIDYVSQQESRRVGKAAWDTFVTDYLPEAEEAAAARNERIDAANSQAREFYLTLEGIQVLCGGCHWAIHRGQRWCSMCGQHWHSPRYEHCFYCLPEERQGQIQVAMAQRAEGIMEDWILEEETEAWVERALLEAQ